MTVRRYDRDRFVTVLLASPERREDLFTVVLEQFQTGTADHADILLPVTTFLEHTDLYLAYGHYYLQLARPALPAPGETRSNVEIFRELAFRMGFNDQCFHDTEDDMIRTLLASGHPFLERITLERLEREHFVRLKERRSFRLPTAALAPLRANANWVGRLSSTSRQWNPASVRASCVPGIRWSWYPPRTTTA